MSSAATKGTKQHKYEKLEWKQPSQKAAKKSPDPSSRVPGIPAPAAGGSNTMGNVKGGVTTGAGGVTIIKRGIFIGGNHSVKVDQRGAKIRGNVRADVSPEQWAQSHDISQKGSGLHAEAATSRSSMTTGTTGSGAPTSHPTGTGPTSGRSSVGGTSGPSGGQNKGGPSGPSKPAPSSTTAPTAAPNGRQWTAMQAAPGTRTGSPTPTPTPTPAAAGPGRRPQAIRGSGGSSSPSSSGPSSPPAAGGGGAGGKGGGGRAPRTPRSAPAPGPAGGGAQPSAALPPAPAGTASQTAAGGRGGGGRTPRTPRTPRSAPPAAAGSTSSQTGTALPPATGGSTSSQPVDDSARQARIAKLHGVRTGGATKGEREAAASRLRSMGVHVPDEHTGSGTRATDTPMGGAAGRTSRADRTRVPAHSRVPTEEELESYAHLFRPEGGPPAAQEAAAPAAKGGKVRAAAGKVAGKVRAFNDRANAAAEARSGAARLRADEAAAGGPEPVTEKLTVVRQGRVRGTDRMKPPGERRGTVSRQGIGTFPAQGLLSGFVPGGRASSIPPTAEKIGANFPAGRIVRQSPPAAPRAGRPTTRSAVGGRARMTTAAEKRAAAEAIANRRESARGKPAPRASASRTARPSRRTKVKSGT